MRLQPCVQRVEAAALCTKGCGPTHSLAGSSSALPPTPSTTHCSTPRYGSRRRATTRASPSTVRAPAPSGPAALRRDRLYTTLYVQAATLYGRGGHPVCPSRSSMRLYRRALDVIHHAAPRRDGLPLQPRHGQPCHPADRDDGRQRHAAGSAACSECCRGTVPPVTTPASWAWGCLFRFLAALRTRGLMSFVVSCRAAQGPQREAVRP